ncbi:membrane integrity-associated transporter subunit PqiC [Oxalobacteraceae bacterium CAVE-383]|nr:membrane integrity-associated transporter subunit PqiC [Oxalobacteraceae bacterium CAVE-383]
MKRTIKRSGDKGSAAAVVAGFAAVFLLAACASAPPLRFYSLAAPASSAAMDAAPVRSAGMFIDVLPVGVPERLARPQLVVRKGNGSDARMDVLEQDRWTAPFNNELHDALADGIAARLGAVDARHGGRQAGQPVYRIAVNLRQFDAISGERVDAAFGWTVTRAEDGRSASCQAAYSVPAGGVGGTGALVAAMQKTVALATVAIAATVDSVKNGTAPACG